MSTVPTLALCIYPLKLTQYTIPLITTVKICKCHAGCIFLFHRIVLDAGYFLDNRSFFENFLTISIYALIVSMTMFTKIIILPDDISL